MEHIRNETTLILSIDVSMTSLTSRFIELISSNHVLVDEHPTIEELDTLTLGCESPLLGSIWVIVSGAPEDSVADLDSCAKCHHAAYFRDITQETSSGLDCHALSLEDIQDLQTHLEAILQKPYDT